MAKKESYEGGQYKGGRRNRPENQRKNLKKVEGGYINVEGVFFSHEDKKALERAVNTANRKRARMLKEAANLPRKEGGRDLGVTIGESLGLMEKESDFILRRKTKSLQRFKTRKQFDTYLANLKRVNQRNYIDIRIHQYKDNYCTALKNAFGKDAEPLVEKIKGMTNREYLRMVESDVLMEIGYVYSEEEHYMKLNTIRNGLGLESVDW